MLEEAYEEPKYTAALEVLYCFKSALSWGILSNKQLKYDISSMVHVKIPQCRLIITLCRDRSDSSSSLIKAVSDILHTDNQEKQTHAVSATEIAVQILCKTVDLTLV